MRSWTRRGVFVLLAFLMTLGGSGWALPAATAAQETQFPARARFLNADTGLEKVEVSLNGVKQLDEFAYGQVSDWIDSKPGVVRLSINADRRGPNYLLYDEVYPVVAGKDYDVIISDYLVIGAPVDLAPLSADSARVRVTNASVDIPPVDIAVAGGDAVVKNLAYGEQSVVADVPAGSNDLEVRTSEAGEVVLTLPGVTVEPGMIYNLVIHGSPGSQDRPLTMTPLVSEARVAEGETTATPVA